MSDAHDLTTVEGYAAWAAARGRELNDGASVGAPVAGSGMLVDMPDPIEDTVSVSFTKDELVALRVLLNHANTHMEMVVMFSHMGTYELIRDFDSGSRKINEAFDNAQRSS